MIKSNRGQLSIFMGITLIIIMGMLAFVINVGLFVKAKINLQNATDAAAFAGAAVQARQLTNIAYLNWEIRNTFKEWMFKYYILGELALVHEDLGGSQTRTGNLSDSVLAGSPTVNFTLTTPPSVVSGDAGFDAYNAPSICVHNTSNNNICGIYALPGIPRFQAIGVAGINEIHEAFVNKLVTEKGADCSRRTLQNFLTALSWAYGTGDPIPGAPDVAMQDVGAWPQALELAFRMRNLEMIMNRPPIEDLNASTVVALETPGKSIGLNERPIKAFWSAYRNLSGGAYKDACVGSGGSCNDELSANLKIQELKPDPYSAESRSVSGFLIPGSFNYPGVGGGANQKYYVDLQMMAVNYATLFSSFVSTKTENPALGVNLQMESACGISKTAIPVPGYILGFNKNPKVLTYYAIKAESKFIGLFFPLGGDGIKLTAYAAAKPFGGRIGPKLFSYEFGNFPTTVKPRDQDPNRRSASYVSGLIPDSGAFKPGMPIPNSALFWIGTNTDPIGGTPGVLGNDIKFGIPNMIYDFENPSDLDVQRNTTDNVQFISPLGVAAKVTAPPQKMGLYQSIQLKALKSALGSLGPGGPAISGDEVLRMLVRARRPTKYDAINYLVPDFREVAEKNNAAPIVEKTGEILGVGFNYKLFAPLIGDDLLYKNATEILTTVTEYMEANQPAVESFLKGLLAVSDSIMTDLPGPLGLSAAKSIHVNAGTATFLPDLLPNGIDEKAPGCNPDLASRFFHFFKADFTGCNLIPIRKSMVDYVNKIALDPDKKNFYFGKYYSFPNFPRIPKLEPEILMSAYFPGERLKATSEGIIEHPLKIGSDTYSGKRNFYSTKFFRMAKVIEGQGASDFTDQGALRESGTQLPQDLLSNSQILNPIKFSELGSKAFFLDF